MSTWLGGLFGGKSKPKRADLSKLSDEEVSEQNKKENIEIWAQFELKAMEDINYDKDCGVKNATCGLDNLGNTCFMSSALQCMSNCPELTRYLLGKEWTKSINAVNTIGSQGRVLCAYAHLLRKIWVNAGYKSSYSPKNFKNTLGKDIRQFAGYEQQDSQEFLQFQLDTLHEDLNKILKKPYQEYKDFEDGDFRKYADDNWKVYQKRDNSMMVNLFYGQYLSKVTCPDCSFVSTKLDPFNMLSLPVPWASTYANMTKCEGYILRYDTDERNLNFIYKAPSQCDGQAVLEYTAKNTSIDSRALRGFYIKNSRVAGEFENLRGSTIEKLMDSSCHLFFIEMFRKKSLNVEEVPFNITTDLVGILYHQGTGKDKNSHSLERVVYFPFKEKSVKNLYILVYSCLRKSVYQNFELRKYYPELENDAEKLWKEVCLLFMNEGSGKPSDKETPTTGKISESRAPFVIKVGEDKLLDTSAEIPAFQGGLSDHFVKVTVSVVFGERLKNPELKLNTSQNPSIDRMPEPTKKSSGTDIYDCLELFSKDEKQDKDNTWYCQKCKAHKQANVRMTPYRLPPILIFHQKRFKNQKERQRYMSGGQYTKNDTFVQFPLEGLDMSSYVPDNNTLGGKPVIYDCFGVVNHMGGRGGGHYTAFCKHPKRQEWCLYDDSRFTSPIDPSRVPNDCAYVVFYRLREQQRVPKQGKHWVDN